MEGFDPKLNSQLATFIAQSKVTNAFSPKSLALLSTFSPTTISYFQDYFLLVNDLKQLQEDFRKCYYDYSFVVVPTHKALEALLIAIYEKIYGLTISTKRNETIGHYLNYGDAQRKEVIKKAFDKLKPVGLNITERKWLEMWNGLCHEWSSNRNPLTHTGTTEEERITSLQQAEHVAGSIIREVDLSCQLISKELAEPVQEYLKKIDVQNNPGK